MKTYSTKNCRRNQNTRLLLLFSPENSAVYETMWNNIVEPHRPQMTIWRMRIACWITKAANTHSEHVLHLLHFYCNNGRTNAPQCYVIRTLLVVFNISYTVTDRHKVM